MIKNEDEILNQIAGKETGMKVPEGYFANFAEQMKSELPEHTFVDDEERTLWQKVRPYVYLAAMFAGIWCTMYIVGQLAGTRPELNPTIAEAFSHESFVDSFVMSPDFDEYTLMQEMCSDSVDFETYLQDYEFPDSI